MRFTTDWHKYSNLLANVHIGPVHNSSEVEDASLTQKKPPYRRDEMPIKLQKQINQKRKLRQLWARTRCPRVKTQLNSITESVAKEVEIWRGAGWDGAIDKASQHDTNLHQLNRQLTRRAQPSYPLIDERGIKIYNPKDRAEILASYLEQQFPPQAVTQGTSAVVLAHHQKVLEEAQKDHTASLDEVKFISPKEVWNVIRRLPRRKAAGHDGLPIAALYKLPRKGITALTALYNGILRTGHFPDNWKTAKIIVFPKPGKDKRVASSYRPISLLPHVAKLFEKLLLRRMNPYIHLRSEQFGFRSHHSTTLQLARVLNDMANLMNRGKTTVAVFLDVEKAFDRVWHEGLLFKLRRTETPRQYINIIQHFLRDRKFYVTVDARESEPRRIRAGVPQGSCLSPTLYALYTDDIPTLKEQLCEGQQDVNLALFADDCAYMTSSRSPQVAANKMQQLLNLLPNWLDMWRTKVNVEKTAAIQISRRTSRPAKLKLRGIEIEWQPCIKYLGVRIDNKLSMRAQVDHSIHQARAARALLRPVLNSRLPLKTKLGIYKTYIRSRLTYAAPAWYGFCSKTEAKRIQSQQNISLRMITGAGRYVSNRTIAKDVKVETVKEFVIRLSKKMFDGADNGPHTHLHDVAPLHARPPDATKSWRTLPRELIASQTMA